MFKVLTDHQNLTYFQKPQILNQQQAWWILDLQEYHFVIKHQPGKTNTKADILSQRANYAQGKNDNIMLKDEWFVHLWDDDSAINDIMIKISQAPKNLRDPKIVKELQNPSSDWMEWWGTIFKKGSHENLNREQQYVPWMEKECEEIIVIYHSWGHPGIKKTRELIQRDFWWPWMKNNLTNYIKACQKCQQAKPDQTKKVAPWHTRRPMGSHIGRLNGPATWIPRIQHGHGSGGLLLKIRVFPTNKHHHHLKRNSLTLY